MNHKNPNPPAQKNQEPEYKLKLFITGTTPNSVRAISNTKEFCEEYLAGRYDLEIIDVYQQPELAAKEQIIAVPILLKMSPLPLRRLIGDMSDKAKMLRGMGIEMNR